MLDQRDTQRARSDSFYGMPIFNDKLKMKRIANPLPPEAVHVLQPFFPGFDLTVIRVCEGIPRYVIGEPLGYADRNMIYLVRGAYQPETLEGLALLAHEITHCRQYHELGIWRFRYRYLSAYTRNRWRGMNHETAYWHVPFEIEARYIESRALDALRERQEFRFELMTRVIISRFSIRMGSLHKMLKSLNDEASSDFANLA